MNSLAVPGARAVSRRARGGARPAPGREPWRRGDAVVLVAVCALASAGMVLGWIGVSGTVRLTSQARWLALDIGSLILAGFAMVGWLMLGMVRIAAVRREVVAALTARGATGDVDADRTMPTAFGTAPGMRRYHRPDCRLLVDKQVQFESRDAHAAAGRLPCGICAPAADRSG